MGKICWGRVFLGGLLAGIVINVIEYVVQYIVLAEDWQQAMAKLGVEQPVWGTTRAMVLLIVLGFVIGIFAVWLYAAIRPRFGPGPKTAVYAAFAVWLVAYLVPTLAALPLGFLPTRLWTISVSVGVVELIVATLLGAWIYREEAVASAA